jgi:hypothetical protein
MRLVKSLVGVLLAVCALTAVVASAAQAVEGPYWKINGTRLTTGGKAPIEAKTSAEYVLKAGTIEIKSKKSKLKAGSELLGSAGTVMGTSKQTIEFEENAVVGNGTGCTIGTITTEPLEGGLAMAAKESGKVLVDFKPIEKAVLSKLKFNPKTGCTLEEATVEGEVAAEAQSESKPAEVGVNEKEAVVGQVVFPTTPIKSASLLLETESTMTPALKAFGKTATLIGASEVKLASGEKWGVFAK